jgi:hypothetical protein
MGFGGLPWDFERQQGLGRPQTGSALHPSVTAVSVKKTLMVWEDFDGSRDRAAASLRPEQFFCCRLVFSSRLLSPKALAFAAATAQ